MNNPEALIELRDAAKAFGPRLLFHHADCRLMPGTVSILAGRNGAGKSTLMRIMAGLSSPDAGTVVRRVPRGATALMAHETFVYPSLTAEENLRFWASAAGIPGSGEAVRSALERTGLSRHARERAGIFSRGMAQRLNLARILLGSPSVLLLDEPATGLDASSRSILRDIILDFRARGAAVVWISHDAGEDSRLADAVMTIADKRLTTAEGGRSC